MPEEKGKGPSEGERGPDIILCNLPWPDMMSEEQLDRIILKLDEEASLDTPAAGAPDQSHPYGEGAEQD